jgi:leucyl aminopeptidase
VAVASEPMARLPWAPRSLDQVRTPFGVRNHPLRDPGRAITSALFLREFVSPDDPWAYCNRTGPSGTRMPAGTAVRAPELAPAARSNHSAARPGSPFVASSMIRRKN